MGKRNKGNVMFQEGQIVQCHRAIKPEHAKLVAYMGQIEVVLNPIESIIHLGEYLVTFPHILPFRCPDCGKHDVIKAFSMLHDELKPIDDPDAGQTNITDEKLPEKVEV